MSRKTKPEMVWVVETSSRAFVACVADVKPCLTVLVAETSGLDEPTQLNQWERMKGTMADQFTTAAAVGWIDPGRMKKDYDLVSTCVGLDKPFVISEAFADILDPSIKMDASKVGH